MSKKILLVSGHLPSDVRGQLFGGEGRLNIELVHLIENNLKSYCELTIYPDNRDLYRDLKNGNAVYDIRDYDYILEVHFNAGGGRGTNIQLHSLYKGGTSVEQNIIDRVASFGFRKRGANGITRRSDLLIMNRCYKYGIDHALIETCFGDSAADMAIYEAHKTEIGKAIADGIIEGFGLSGSEAKQMQVVNCSVVNIRQTPNGRVVATAKKGTTINIIGSGKDSDGDEWLEVRSGQHTGYVWPKYLA